MVFFYHKLSPPRTMCRCPMWLPFSWGMMASSFAVAGLNAFDLKPIIRYTFAPGAIKKSGKIIIIKPIIIGLRDINLKKEGHHIYFALLQALILIFVDGRNPMSGASDGDVQARWARLDPMRSESPTITSTRTLDL